jgi:hypothetical protein
MYEEPPLTPGDGVGTDTDEYFWSAYQGPEYQDHGEEDATDCEDMSQIEGWGQDDIPY